MPDFLGQTLSGAALVFWGFWQFYRFLSVERLVKLEPVDEIVLNPLAYGIWQTAFGFTGLFLQVTIATSHGSKTAADVVTALEFRPGLLTFAAFTLAGAVQVLFAVGRLVPLRNPAPSSSNRVLLPLRFAPSFALLFAALLLLIPDRPTRAESLASVLLTIMLGLTACTNTAVTWSMFGSLSTSNSQSGGSGALFADSLLLQTTGYFSVWTGFNFYSNYTAFAANSTLTAVSRGELPLLLAGILLLVALFMIAAIVLLRCCMCVSDEADANVPAGPDHIISFAHESLELAAIESESQSQSGASTARSTDPIFRSNATSFSSNGSVIPNQIHAVSDNAFCPSYARVAGDFEDEGKCSIELQLVSSSGTVEMWEDFDHRDSMPNSDFPTSSSSAPAAASFSTASSSSASASASSPSGGNSIRVPARTRPSSMAALASGMAATAAAAAASKALYSASATAAQNADRMAGMSTSTSSSSSKKKKAIKTSSPSSTEAMASSSSSSTLVVLDTASAASAPAVSSKKKSNKSSVSASSSVLPTIPENTDVISAPLDAAIPLSASSNTSYVVADAAPTKKKKKVRVIEPSSSNSPPSQSTPSSSATALGTSAPIPSASVLPASPFILPPPPADAAFFIPSSEIAQQPVVAAPPPSFQPLDASFSLFELSVEDLAAVRKAADADPILDLI